MRSKKMSELCERFEEGDEGKSSQAGGGEEKSDVSFISFKKNKNYIFLH